MYKWLLFSMINRDDLIILQIFLSIMRISRIYTFFFCNASYEAMGVLTIFNIKVASIGDSNEYKND